MSEESRDKIIKGAMSLFLEQGIKTVTMDKIAASLVVSKRTIYEHFEGKEELVQGCLDYFKSENDQMLEQLRRESSNSFVFLLSVFSKTFHMLQKINVNFFIDIETMFPNHVEKSKLSKPVQIERFSKLIAESQEEGFIEKSLSPDILSHVYYGMLASLRDKDAYDFSKVSLAEVLRVLVITFFKGVATKKGIDLIDRYDKENYSRTKIN